MAKVRIYLINDTTKVNFTYPVGLVKVLRFGKIIDWNEMEEPYWVEIECLKRVVTSCIRQAGSYMIKAEEIK